MADRRGDGNKYPRWLSISGEELELDLPSGLLGKFELLLYEIRILLTNPPIVTREMSFHTRL